MSRGYWIAGIALVALVLGLSFWGATSSLNYIRQNQESQNAAADEYARYASAKEICGTIIPLAARPSCLAERIDTNHQQQHAEADIQAQLDMASWTYAILWVGIVGIVVSVVGIALIFETLRETRTLTIETRRIGEAQVRAYISSDGFAVKLLAGEAGEIQAVKFIPRIKNTGQSPAFMTCMYSYGIHVEGMLCPVIEFSEDEAACREEIGSGSSFTLAGQIFNFDDIKKSVTDGHVIYVLGYAAYRHVFCLSGEREAVSFCFRVEIDANPDNLNPQNFGNNLSFVSVPDFRMRPA
ncbi:MAG: hypothetical protein ACQRW7_02130 [Caulobacterales bacterium]|uniref:hypothetical protein n=1 Tax=Glycocaulis sp. TaxID=1969725 RepID=UPI003F9FF8CF